MSGYIHFQRQDAREISSRFAHGVIVTNPPYGERLMRGRELSELYASFGRAFPAWRSGARTSSPHGPSFERDFGRRADRVRVLYNSELECRFYRFLGAPPARLREKDAYGGDKPSDEEKGI